jgi:hypothetical protein
MIDDPIKLYYLFKRNRFELMAVGVSHPKFRSAINIGEASGDVWV